MTAQTLLAEVRDLQRELRRLDEDAAPSDGTETFISRAGVYLSGHPYVWSSDARRAFCFRNEEQARDLINRFPVALKGARVGQFKKDTHSCSSPTSSRCPTVNSN